MISISHRRSTFRLSYLSRTESASPSIIVIPNRRTNLYSIHTTRKDIRIETIWPRERDDNHKNPELQTQNEPTISVVAQRRCTISKTMPVASLFTPLTLLSAYSLQIVDTYPFLRLTPHTESYLTKLDGLYAVQVFLRPHTSFSSEVWCSSLKSLASVWNEQSTTFLVTALGPRD